MGKYILKRIALAIVTIWAVATITFFLMNLVPGGPFLSEKAISPAATKALEAKYGLDKPMAERYFTYISDAAHGDFGDSLKQRGRTVMDIIATKFPVSARLGGMAVVLALCVGVPLGVLAAYKRGTFIDSLFSVIATCGIAVPGFVICTLLLYVFGVKLQWLPTLGLKCAELHYAGGCAGSLSDIIYHASDAFIHAGCSRPGLYAYSEGKGVVTEGFPV